MSGRDHPRGDYAQTTDEETELGLPTLHSMEGDATRRTQQRLSLVLPHKRILQHLKCPVCFELCSSRTMVVCCPSGHHLCLPCATGICAKQNISEHRCPVCKDTFQCRDIPVSMRHMIDEVLPSHVLYGRHPGDPVTEKHPYALYAKYMRSMTDTAVPHKARAFYSYYHVVIFSNLLHVYKESLDAKMDTCIEYKRIQGDIHRVLARLHIGQ